MNPSEKAVLELQSIDDLAGQDSFIHRLDALAKLFVTVVYIAVTVSFSRYDLSGLVFMILYPAVCYQLAGIPLSSCLHKMRFVLPVICAVGLLNPIFDRAILVRIAGVSISGGVISMLSLMLKGVCCLTASFLLIATTPIDGVCSALRRIHLPKLLTSLLLLTFRYIPLLLDEVTVMTEAYRLRAPGQKGLHYSVWGSFLGQLVLRSMDRATALYESMELRGFHGEFHYAEPHRASRWSIPYAIAWTAVLLAGRFFNIPALLGTLVI